MMYSVYQVDTLSTKPWIKATESSFASIFVLSSFTCTTSILNGENVEQNFFQLFEERPIWSQNQIRYQTKIKISSVKIILPCLSIYMRNGPWRMMWIRFGYDPRKEPGARFYQTLDFRLRHQGEVKGSHICVIDIKLNNFELQVKL